MTSSATPLHDASASPFAADVKHGLEARPKSLPPKYFYDALGSQLFEAICQLPWYPITRAETMLLELYAAEMIEPMGPLDALVELGCGSGAKLAIVAKALEGRGPVDVHLVDVSPRAIELSSKTLADLGHVSVTGHAVSYEAGLRKLARRGGAGRKLVLFLGSNIGNFDPPAAGALLGEIRRALRIGDGLLLGADLVRAEADLLRAYDDPLGVTAAFNKNVLLRMNQELGADFDLASFDHAARWDAKASRVEMHLVSRRAQAVHVPGADVTARFDAGESIWTESSYKYTPERLVEMGRAAGLAPVRQWIEPDGRFCATLFRASSKQSLQRGAA
ncbi:MAG TPA: L-histidine N(alpha)-methyltransferase [Minicystis sp.]|nr:L-histidine N(alpha)-methyltransferase [Minicystis sp.]